MSIWGRPRRADVVDHKIEPARVGAEGADQALDVGFVSSLLPAHHVAVKAHAQVGQGATIAR